MTHIISKAHLSLSRLKELLEKIQKLTDEYIKNLDAVSADKEKEIMTV